MQTAVINPIRAVGDEQMAGMLEQLNRLSATRRDYIVPAKDLRAVADPEMVKFAITFASDQPPAIFEPTWTAHEGVFYRFGINRNYYDKCGTDAPDLLAYNINYWAERDNRNFMVRTIDGKMRAILSDRFRTMDSAELFYTAYTEVRQFDAKIVQCDLTESHFYMKILHPDWAVKVENFRTNIWQRRTNRPGGSLYHVLDHLEEDGGQWLVPGIVLTNSDVGKGSLSADLFVFDTICWNGLVHNRTIHKVHLGARLELGLISPETRNLEDQTLWSQVKDMIRTSFNQEEFLAYIQRLQAATETPLENPTEAVETVVKNHGFSDEDKQNILNELISAGSNTVYGLLTAVTAVGRDKPDYDEGIRFERAGGDILENQGDFVRIRRRGVRRN